MDVRFDGEAKGQPKLLGNSEVASDIFNDGIDDDRLARTAIGHDVGSTFRSVIDILCLIDVKQDAVNYFGISSKPQVGNRD